jgi:hypothetical protein
MRLFSERREFIAYNPVEGRSVWEARQADAPLIVQISGVLGLAVTLVLATGAGLMPPRDWGGAVLAGLATAVTLRGGILVVRHLTGGGWRAWCRARANETAIDRLSIGGAGALFLLLVSGGGGVGPPVPLIEATLATIATGLLLRGILMLLKWP